MKGEQAYSHSRGACIGIGRQSGPNNPDCQFPRLFVGQDGKRICDGGVERQCEQSLSHGQRIGAGHSILTVVVNQPSTFGLPYRHRFFICLAIFCLCWFFSNRKWTMLLTFVCFFLLRAIWSLFLLVARRS
jgi:hypothetical protein